MAVIAVAIGLLVVCLLSPSGAENLKNRTIGTTVVHLDHSQCNTKECNVANFINEAMIEELVKSAEPGAWTSASIAATNAGGFQGSINETTNPGGAFTYNDLLKVQPWNNTFDVIELQGKVLMEALEHSANKIGTSGFMHWAGLRVRYDLTAAANSRVKSVNILCRRCRVPQYEPLDVNQWYRVTMNNFLVDGDDGYTMFLPNLRNRKVGRLDMDVVVDYVAKRSPITQGIDGRIEFLHS